MTTRKTTRWMGGTMALLALSVLTGCGGGNTSDPGPSQILDLTPSTVTLTRGATQQFTASVSSTIKPVWEILQDGSVLQDGSGGTITNTGLYTAPMKAGTFRIRYYDSSPFGIVSFATVTVQ